MVTTIYIKQEDEDVWIQFIRKYKDTTGFSPILVELVKSHLKTLNDGKV